VDSSAAALRRRLRYRPARLLSAQSGAGAVQQAHKKLDEQLHTENVRATIQQFKKQHQHMYDAADEEKGDEKKHAEKEARQQQYYYLRRQTLHACAQQLRRMEHNLLLRNRGAHVLVHGAGKERKQRVAFLRTPWSAQGEHSSTAAPLGRLPSSSFVLHRRTDMKLQFILIWMDMELPLDWADPPHR